jgi:hypothetical protein
MANLTTLSAVKAYLAITTSNQDALISALIARESKVIETWTGRRFPTVTNTAKRLNGTGTSMLMLPDSPVLDVSLLQINAVDVPLSADGVQAGYQFDDTTLYLVGSKFPQGRQNVTCTWTAGYREIEDATIPSGDAPTLTPATSGIAIRDVSVKSAAGEIFTKVDSVPHTHQYTFHGGTYAFNVLDAETEVVLTYDYVPAPIEQACIDMVSQDLKQRDNVGIKSKTLAGETISYNSDGISTGVQQVLKMFRKLAPV